MVPPVYPVIASVYPVLKELSGPKNMLSGQYYSDCTGSFFVSTGLTGAYRNQLHSASYFGHNSLLRTPISMILYSMESFWNSLKESAEDHIIWPKFEHRCNRWSSVEPVLPEISFHSTSYFGHNSLLRTPILMILYSMENLWNALQDSAEDQLIWPKFEHRCNRCHTEISFLMFWS